MAFKIEQRHFDHEMIIMNTKGLKELRVNVISGKDPGGYYIHVIPSLNISGYGKDRNSSFESVKHNIDTFIEDLNLLSNKQRVNYINSLGWKQENLHNKKYSKAVVDYKGELKNFQISEPKFQSMATELVA